MSIQTIRVVFVGTFPKATGPFPASLELTSSGDVNDSSTFDATNSGIKQLDVNSITMFTVWSDGTFGGNIFIVDKLPAGFEFGSATDNVFIGTQLGVGLTSGSSDVGIGNSALQNITEGTSNVSIGTSSGFTTTDGNENVFIGTDAHAAEVSGSNIVVVGQGGVAGSGVTANAIALGSAATVTANNTAVIGNSSMTDVYFGSDAGLAKLHGKGDAIVFPDSDPHVAGAAYWIAGVLHKSAG